MIRDAATTWHLLREARSSSHRPAAWFHSRQEAVLHRLLRHAYDRVPLYRRLYDEAGFRPEQFRSLADLARIPPLTKAMLKRARPDETIARGTDRGKCSIEHTSGSTGVPLEIVLGRFDRCWNRAVAWRILFEHGFRWTDRTLEIRMRAGPSYAVQKFGLAPKDWGSILDPPSTWVGLLEAKRHQCVVSGAGTLDLLASAALDSGIATPRIVVSDSETLTPATRARIHRVLGTNPIDVYGLEEVSNFAWECERRDGLHVSADSHIVEVGAPAGEVGPVTVTALGMWTMPFIRYETGDLAEAAAHACPCGRSLPLLSAVHGRAVDSIELPGGRKLLWPFFHAVLGAESMVEQWQIRQPRPAEILVHVVLRPGDDRTPDRIRSSMQGRLPADVRVMVESRKSIAVESNGKRRLVIPFGC